MKVSEVIQFLKEIQKEHGDLECWYSSDDEGNSFRKLFYEPSVCYVDSYGETYGTNEDLEYADLKPEDVRKICVVN